MKIPALSYQERIWKQQIPFVRLDNMAVMPENISDKEVSIEALENYNFAKTYYNQKLDNEGQIFQDEQSLSRVIEDKKASENLLKFFRERAQAELLELNNKTGLSEEERERAEGLKEIIKAFPAPIHTATSGQYCQNISFGAKVTSDQKMKCHLAIHSASAACGGISLAMGEGAAVGADTPFLRGTQALMFLCLQKILNVGLPSSIIYAGRQYVMGSYIGTRGAQILIGWLGIGGHAVTGGTGSAPITGAVRGVNSALSTAITEKMGWGYVKSYEQDQMNIKSQAISTAIYAATMGILHFHDQSILDSSNYSDVQTALGKISKEKVSMLGDIMHTLTGTFNLPRAGTIFTATLAQGLLTAKDMDEKSKKEYYKNLIGMSLMNTLFYEILNIPEDTIIKEEALEAIQKMREDLNNTPEVFKEFREIEQEIMDKLKLNDLNSHDFVKQFKDKDLLINLAFSVGDMTTILADKWRKRNFEILRESKKAAQEKLARERQKSGNLNSKIDPKKQKELDNEMKNLVEKTKENLLEKTRANHALGRIAGYDGTKVLLNMSYIQPVKINQEDAVPNILLFYGPSGSGKTAIGLAIAEDVGAKFRNKSLGMGDEKRILDWIKKQMDAAEESYQKTNRYSIIQLNEFDEFLNNNPKLLKEFLNLTDNCVKKYHTTFFLTTNNPLSINRNIMDRIDITVPMGVAESDDIKQIVQHYVNDKEITGYNLEEITNEFERVKPDYAYSNAQIEAIITTKLPKLECSQQDVINAIRGIKPCITSETLDKFNNEQNVLERQKK